MDELTENDSLEEAASKQTSYVENLSVVNKTNAVVASQDIFNGNGLLVARAGCRITEHVSDIIVQHKLVTPLEESVKLENSLTNTAINKAIAEVLIKYPDLGKIHETCNFQKQLDRILSSSILKSILLQELTVMRECFPVHFEKTLFCAWLSALMATKLGMKDHIVYDAFLSGLFHDIGFLHISPDIVNKKGNLSAAEWRAIQCHVVIGQMLAKKIYGSDSAICKSVLEHHERCDGSGYPLGKFGDEIDIMSKIVGMADSIQAIRVDKFSKCKRNMSDILPYLKMNKYTYSLEVSNVMHTIISKSGLSPSAVNPLGDIESLVTHLEYMGKNMQGSVVCLQDLLRYDESHENGVLLKKLLAIAKPVSIMISSSGLVADEIINWLSLMKKNKTEREEDHLIDVELMYSELYWQLKRVCKTMKACLGENDNDFSEEYRVMIEMNNTQIESFLDKVDKALETVYRVRDAAG